jgi:hypothetical protein
LGGTVCDPNAPIPVIPNQEIVDAGLEIEGDRVYGWRTRYSQHCGNQQYKPGQCYEAPVFSVCTKTDCHPGIYLAGREWLEKDYAGLSVRCYCMRNELVHAGDKWRCKRLWIVPDQE